MEISLKSVALVVV